jgi:hypothetical protein
MKVAQRGRAWLLLTFTLPAKRASQRVEVWRRLRRLGSIPLGNAGYLLPSDAANRERFEWLATAIRNYSGEASVLEVSSVDNLSPQQIAAQFQEARAADYQELMREAQRVAARPVEQRSPARMARLRQRLQEIAAVDFFRTPQRRRAEEAVESASRIREALRGSESEAAKNRKKYQGRLWVTRSRPGVDRVCSAWLIRKFIDRRARFGFATDNRVPSEGIPFDMFQPGGFGHQGNHCTFETLVHEFRVQDRRVKVMAQIVHDADLNDERFGRYEGLGLDEILKGWGRLGWRDRDILERGMEMAEGLCQSLG